MALQKPLIAGFTTLILTILTGNAAYAHPLGNFTINHLAKITADRDGLYTRYILDIAEIPTFQILHQQPLRQWSASESALVQSEFNVRNDGKPLVLHLISARALLRPGAGGLPIIRWVGEFYSPFDPSAKHRIVINDRVYADRRIGWKDIIAGTQTEPTNELRRYPNALLGSPRHIAAASLAIGPDGTISDVARYPDSIVEPASLASWISPGALSDMFTRQNQTPLFVALTLLAALGLGALHGIEPGHGKALLAFTLVGSRATVKQATMLALSLTFAHTAGVLLLGLALFFAAGFVSESIYPWITLASGVGIAIIGARALGAYLASTRSAALRQAQGDIIEPHSHAVMPLNFRSAVFAAMSGGIAPCPAAIVVLLAALRLHQLGYGLVLIVLFSLGLAGILTAIGIGVVRGASFLSRTSAYERFVNYGPLVTATIISVIGAWTLAQGFAQQGVNSSPVLIAALALLAIAGYAFSQRHSHAHGHAHSHGHSHSHAQMGAHGS